MSLSRDIARWEQTLIPPPVSLWRGAAPEEHFRPHSLLHSRLEEASGVHFLDCWSPAIKAALGPSSHLLPRLGSGCVRSAGAQFPLAGGAQGLVVGRAVEPRATANQFGHKSQLSQPSLFHLITSLSEHSLPVHTNPPHPRRGCLTIHGVATPVSSTSSLSLPT